MRRSILTLVSLGVLFATPALADPTTIRIPVTASDLQSPEAVDALYQRVVDAADNLCVATASPTALDRSSCRAATVDKAVKDAHLAPLSARHDQTPQITIVTSAADR